LASNGIAAARIAEGSAVHPDTFFRLTPFSGWAGMVAGGLIVIVAFCWDWRNLAAGNVPNPFRWDLYLVGLLGAIACFLYGAARWQKVSG
jgi:hypothetical protein